MKEAIEQLWGDLSLSGVWDDGQQTEAKIQVEVAANSDTACADNLGKGSIEIPVLVTYGTTDGRLAIHSVDTVLNAHLENNGSLSSSDIWIDEHIICKDENDTLAYTWSSCTELESVQIQFSVNNYDNASFVSGEGLNVYERNRRSLAPPGAADQVRVLTIASDD